MSDILNHNLRVEHLAELPSVASQLISLAGNRKIWLFKGEMGAGKTTLIKELCKQLGTTSELSSPTFAIVNEYTTSSSKKIYHFDLYRIKKKEELFDIGFDEYLESDNYCFIEWPEIGETENNYNCIILNISRGENEKRQIELRLL